MKYNINQGIGIFENAFSNDWCNKVIDLFENNLQYSYDRKYQEPDTDSLDIEDLSVNFKDINPENFNKFVEYTFSNIYPLYVDKFSILKSIGSHNIKSGKIQKTLPSQGYHIWHCEHSGLRLMNRIAAYTVYLNDVKEGGETEFLYKSLRVPATQGTFCIFPAGYTHVHRGNPPLSGVKYILTGWFELIDEN